MIASYDPILKTIDLGDQRTSIIVPESGPDEALVVEAASKRRRLIGSDWRFAPRNPRIYRNLYLVDTSTHQIAIPVNLADLDQSVPYRVHVAFDCRVHDPVVIVRRNIRDVVAFVRPFLMKSMRGLISELSLGPMFFDSMEVAITLSEAGEVIQNYLNKSRVGAAISIADSRIELDAAGSAFGAESPNRENSSARGSARDVALAQETDHAVAFQVTIYVSDGSIHEHVEAAVQDLLEIAGCDIELRDDPVHGSWFRRLRARMRAVASSPLVHETAIMATHAAEMRMVHSRDATVTATMMQNLAPVLTALQPTKDAIIRVGALLIVKVDWTVQVHQLTAAQQLRLDHAPALSRSPHEILAALAISSESEIDQSTDLDRHAAAQPTIRREPDIQGIQP